MKHNEVNTKTTPKKRKVSKEMKTTAISKKEKKPKTNIKSKTCRKNKVKKNFTIESATRDTIAETIAFVIKGHLTPIKPTPLPINKILKHNADAKEQKRRCCRVQKVKKEKADTKSQTRTVIPQAVKISTKNRFCKSAGVNKDETQIPKISKKLKLPARLKKTSDSNKNTAKKISKKIIKVPTKNVLTKSKKQSSENTFKNNENRTTKIVTSKKVIAGKTGKNEILENHNKLLKPPIKIVGTTSIVKPRKKYVRRKPECKKDSYEKPPKGKTVIKTKQETVDKEEKQQESSQIIIKEEKPDNFQFPVVIKTELEIEMGPTSQKDSIKVLIPETSKETCKQEERDKAPSRSENKKGKISECLTDKKHKIKKLMHLKKKTLANKKTKKQLDEKRRAKLLQFWNSPRRHRVASLNAIAKVHCLYENESKAAFDKMAENAMIKREPVNKASENEKGKINYRKISSIREIDKHLLSESDESDSEIPVKRTLRDVPGLRAVGKHWDMHDSISSDNNSDVEIRKITKKVVKIKKEAVSKKPEKCQISKKPEKERKKRQRKEKQEVVMDLKDMVVKKRMASLNASAILAASYSSDKKPGRSSRSSDDSSSYDTDSSAEEYFAAEIDLTKDLKEDVTKEDDANLIEVHTTPNKKVAVILNQDTDVTITGVYVNSTTRSTHHEGYCSIAGMQYRISATSHTQTAATAVATETILQSNSSSSENANSDGQLSGSSKSYTPLEALSTMQPPPGPGIHNTSTGHHGMPCQTMPPHQLGSPPHRQQKSSSAFSSPHHAPPGYPPSSSQGISQGYPPPPAGPSPREPSPGYAHGYYQPAGPLISMTHAHGQSPMQQPPLTKSVPLSDTSPSSVTSPVHQPHPPPAPSSNNGDSSDNEVIITSVTAGTKDPPHPTAHQSTTSYRYPQYSQYPYSYPPQYHYPTPPPPNPSYAHHEMCYPVAPPSGYVRHTKYAAPTATYHRYPYYPAHGSDMYPPSSAPPAQPSQQVVTASPVSSNGSYPPVPSGPLPPPTIMETYPPPPAPPTLVDTYQPPPPHYYPPTYGLPPTCYSHSPTRAISYINAAYQPCPCPLNTCPKNGHTGPLTGESKRSNISKDSMPLPPVALALPLEPASATGPPSPARGSAGMPSGGMPPPPSPAGASYQMPAAPTPKQESHSPGAPECKVEKRKARVGKAMVRSNMQNTMLLMCNPNQDFVKREIESPKDKEELHKKEGDNNEQPVNKNSTTTETGTITCTNGNCEASINPIQKDPLSLDEPKTAQSTPMEIITEKLDENENKEHIEATSSIRIPTPPSEEEPLPPCVATVAENVKVKNMKRKQSLTKEQVPDIIVPPPTKKKKSSYKDFIRKHTSCFKISNGKRKLVSKTGNRLEMPKIKLKTPTKKKLNASKEQTNNRRIKKIKTPLTECNRPAQKQSHKKNNPASNTKPEAFKTKYKSNTVIKTAAKILDNLIARNNVDKVIEEVINNSMRTVSDVSAGKDKCRNKEAKKMDMKITKLVKNECKKIGASRRKSTTKCKNDPVAELPAKIPRKLIQLPKWSNGWTWEGETYEGRVFLNSDETTVIRKCYPAMRHLEGDIIRPGNCVLLKAGPRKNDLPYVAKIAALWENPEDGEMMMALLWYYRPEHTEQGRLPNDQPDEVFASRHKDSNSVACIDDRCYVLTFNEYCRYKKEFKRREEGLEEKSTCIPILENYPRINRQPPSSNISPEMVFFCRKVYDFRQKRIIKNPT